MIERSEECLRFRRDLFLGYLALFSLLAALISWKVISEYRADREAAAIVTRISSRAMAAHVQEIIEAVDQPLRISAWQIAAARRP